MSVIGPGTVLICVDASPGYASGDSVSLTKDALYFCSRVRNDICVHCGNKLIELHDVFWFYCPNRFKPLIDGLDQVIEEEEKEPTDDRIQVDA